MVEEDIENPLEEIQQKDLEDFGEKVLVEAVEKYIEKAPEAAPSEDNAGGRLYGIGRRSP